MQCRPEFCAARFGSAERSVRSSWDDVVERRAAERGDVGASRPEVVAGVFRPRADQPRAARHARQSRSHDGDAAHCGKPLPARLRCIGRTAEPRRHGQISARAVQPERPCEPADPIVAARYADASDRAAERIHPRLRRVVGARPLGPGAPAGRGRRRADRGRRGRSARDDGLPARRGRARLHPAARLAGLARQRQRESEGRTGSPRADAHAPGEGAHHGARRRKRRCSGRGGAGDDPWLRAAGERADQCAELPARHAAERPQGGARARQGDAARSGARARRRSLRTCASTSRYPPRRSGAACADR